MLILYWIFKYIYNKKRDDLKSQYLTFSINLSSFTPFFTRELLPVQTCILNPFIFPLNPIKFSSRTQYFLLFPMISLSVQRFFRIKNIKSFNVENYGYPYKDK